MLKAAADVDVEQMEKLLHQGASANTVSYRHHNTPLHKLFRHAPIKTVEDRKKAIVALKLLLQNGASESLDKFDYQDRTPIDLAEENNWLREYYGMDLKTKRTFTELGLDFNAQLKKTLERKDTRCVPNFEKGQHY